MSINKIVIKDNCLIPKVLKGHTSQENCIYRNVDEVLMISNIS